MGFSPTLSAAITETFTVPDSDATVTLKYIKPGVMQGIVQASMQMTAKEKDAGGMGSEIAFNMTKKARDIVVASISKWTGFTDDDGHNMKCTQSNILKMMDESEEFIDWVVEKQEKMASRIESEKEEAEKN